MTTTRNTLAANVRARLAWAGLKSGDLQKHMEWSRTTTHYKLTGVRPIDGDEIYKLADFFELPDPGVLFSAPDGFTMPVRQRAAELLSSTKSQLVRLTWAFARWRQPAALPA